MRIVKANAELYDMDDLKMSAYQFMERIGRICYKSEDKITNESAIKFIKALGKNKHTAMFEHAHIYMTMSALELADIKLALDFEAEMADEGQISPLRNYFNITEEYPFYIISGNFRVWCHFLDWYSNLNTAFKSTLVCNTTSMHAMESQEEYPSDYIYQDINKVLSEDGGTVMKTMSELKMQLHDRYPEVFTNACTANECDAAHTVIGFEELEIFESPNAFIRKITENGVDNKVTKILRKHIVHTVIFTCDRGISHEFVRHRPASFAQESTRYCNYNNDKFGKEITVIEPCFWVEGIQPETHDANVTSAFNAWYDSCKYAEKMYFKILESGGTPQQARDVLPTSVKTEIAITATENEWAHIINLRKFGTTGSPHPQMVEVMDIAYPQLVKASDNRLNKDLLC